MSNNIKQLEDLDPLISLRHTTFGPNQTHLALLLDQLQCNEAKKKISSMDPLIKVIFLKVQQSNCALVGTCVARWQNSQMLLTFCIAIDMKLVQIPITMLTP